MRDPNGNREEQGESSGGMINCIKGIDTVVRACIE
jgi:hypothetical protein